MSTKILSPLLILIFSLLSGCSFTDSQTLRKSQGYSLDFKNTDWTSIAPREADKAFISNKTSSILLLNSLCGIYEATSLNHLISNMMGGIEDVQIQRKQENELINRKSLRTYAIGEIDGVPIFLIIETVRKDSCIYDFALISNSEKTRSKDEDRFNEFLRGLNVP